MCTFKYVYTEFIHTYTHTQNCGQGKAVSLACGHTLMPWEKSIASISPHHPMRVKKKIKMFSPLVL